MGVLRHLPLLFKEPFKLNNTVRRPPIVQDTLSSRHQRRCRYLSGGKEESFTMIFRDFKQMLNNFVRVLKKRNNVQIKPEIC